MRHIFGVHEGEKDHKCDKCPKAFFRKKDLMKHINNHKNHKCEECPNVSFGKKKDLTMHYFSVHETHWGWAENCKKTPLAK